MSGVNRARALFGLLLLAPAVQAGVKHPVRFDDLVSLRDVDQLQLSPDGKMLAYAAHPLTTAARHEAADSEIWFIATQPGSTAKKVAAGMLPAWSPDGKHVAFYAGAAGAYQLWAWDVRSGTLRQLTHVDGGIDPDPWTRFAGWYYEPLLVSWSPDSTRIVFASQVFLRSDAVERSTGAEDSGTPLILTLQTPPQWTLKGVLAHDPASNLWPGWEAPAPASDARSGPAAKISQLFVADLRSGTATQLTHDDGGCFDPDWSPDGATIACTSSEGTRLTQANVGSVATNLYAVDISSRRKTALTTGPGIKRRPRWSPDGARIAYLSGGFSGPQTSGVMSAAGGPPLEVDEKAGREVEDVFWRHDARVLIELTAEGLYGVNLRSRSVKRLFPKVQIQAPATLSRSGTVTWKDRHDRSLGALKLLPERAHSAYELVELNPQIKAWELGKQELVRWRNSRGDALEGVLIKPVRYRPGQRYPLIVDAYPGADTGFRANPMAQNQVWASEGYLSFNPSRIRVPHLASTTPMDGQKPSSLPSWDTTVDDVMSGVDALIERGLVDPERMCLYGFSNGGGVVNALVTRTQRFKCAVSVAAVMPDWISSVMLEFNSFALLQSGTTPWKNPQAYIDLSAVFHLEGVTTPMLLADGDEDAGFLLGMIEMYNGLRWLGKDVTLLRYPNQAHGFTGAPLRDFWSRESAFFARYLEPEPREFTARQGLIDTSSSHFKQLDTNGDGHLSASEAAADPAVAAVFSQADTSKATPRSDSGTMPPDTALPPLDTTNPAPPQQ